MTSRTLNTFTVIYRTGGPAMCAWHKCLAVLTMEEAIEMKRDIERGGRKAIIHKTDELNALGMPEGWEA